MGETENAVISTEYVGSLGYGAESKIPVGGDSLRPGLEGVAALSADRGLGRRLCVAEKQEAAEGTVEHWARSPKNPIGGWYGLKKGFRGRFAMYIPPLMEELGLAEVEHNPRNNRMRAK